MSDNRALKFISATDDTLILEGPIALFMGKDLVQEHFHKGTNFESAYTRTGRLLVDWEHGLEPDVDETGKRIKQPGEDDVMGYIDWLTARTDDIGLLANYVLDRRERYVSAFIEPLARAGMVGASSEAVPNGIVKSADGRIDDWPLKRQSLTVNPCDTRMLTDHQVSVIKSLAEQHPELKALLPQAPGDGAAGATDGGESTETPIVPHIEATSTDSNVLWLRAGAYLASKGEK